MSVSETVMRMVEPYHTSAQITAASATQSSASSTWLRFQSRRSPSRSAPPTVSCSSSAACSGGPKAAVICSSVHSPPRASLISSARPSVSRRLVARRAVSAPETARQYFSMPFTPGPPFQQCGNEHG